MSKGGQEELAVLLSGFEEVPLALEGERLLHLTGAAGVVLRTEPQVLTWTKIENKVKTDDTLCTVFLVSGLLLIPNQRQRPILSNVSRFIIWSKQMFLGRKSIPPLISVFSGEILSKIMV